MVLAVSLQLLASAGANKMFWLGTVLVGFWVFNPVRVVDAGHVGVQDFFGAGRFVP